MLSLTGRLFLIALLAIAISSYDVMAQQEEVVVIEEVQITELLTLEDALSLAIAENPGIDNSILEVEKAESAVKAARTKLFPEFEFNIYELYHLTDEAFEFQQGAFGDFPIIGPIPAETTEIATAPNFTTFLTASVGQPISQLYEISLIVRQRELEKDIFNQQLRANRQEITDRVKNEYYNILKSHSSIAANEEKIVFLTSLDELLDRYVEEKRVLESESLEVKARLKRVEYQQLKLRNQMDTEKERMNKLLGRDVETPFTVTPIPGSSSIIINPEEAEETALEQRPEIKAAELNIEFAENEVKLKKSKYIPEIGVEFSYTANFNIELLPENIATIGLFAKWDVFDWGRKQYQIAEKKRAVQQAVNDLDEARSQVIIEVNTKIRKLEESSVLIGVTEAEQIAAREKLREITNQFKVQEALLTQVLEAESSLEEKNKNYQDAVLGYWSARANLLKALGEE